MPTDVHCQAHSKARHSHLLPILPSSSSSWKAYIHACFKAAAQPCHIPIMVPLYILVRCLFVSTPVINTITHGIGVHGSMTHGIEHTHCQPMQTTPLLATVLVTSCCKLLHSQHIGASTRLVICHDRSRSCPALGKLDQVTLQCHQQPLTCHQSIACQIVEARSHHTTSWLHCTWLRLQQLLLAPWPWLMMTSQLGFGGRCVQHWLQLHGHAHAP